MINSQILTVVSNLKLFHSDSTQNLFVVMGALYSSCLFLGVNNASSVQPIVAIERTVFYREKAAGMYSPLPYAAAQVSTFTSSASQLLRVATDIIIVFWYFLNYSIRWYIELLLE